VVAARRSSAKAAMFTGVFALGASVNREQEEDQGFLTGE
jgi:hypothetical protein